MIAFIGYSMLLLLNFANSVSNRRCFPLDDGSALCFTQPDPPLSLPWSNASQWCKNIGATLPITLEGYNTIYSAAYNYFRPYSETPWLGGTSTCGRNNSWYWTNGSLFTGTIENWQRLGDTHAYFVRNGTQFKLVAGGPLGRKSIICQHDKYSEVSCASVMNSYWLNGKCYNICGNGSTWYSYWSNYGPTNIVSYEVVKELSMWIKDMTHIWVGLRILWWNWHDADWSYEIMDNRLGSTFIVPPCFTQCLTSYTPSQVSLYWTTRDCNYDSPFICQQHVNQTTTTRPTSRTTIATSSKKSSDRWSTSTQKANITSFPEGDKASSSANNDDIVGIRLGFGLVGGLLLIIMLVLITVYVYRKIRHSAGNKVGVPKTSCKNYSLSDESGRADMQKADESTYEAVELHTNEHLYQPIVRR